MTMTTENNKKKKSLNWLIYLSLIIAGSLFLADAFDVTYLNRWTARAGVGLIFTAFSFIVGAGHQKAPIAIGILWGSILAIYFL